MSKAIKERMVILPQVDITDQRLPISVRDSQPIILSVPISQPQPIKYKNPQKIPTPKINLAERLNIHQQSLNFNSPIPNLFADSMRSFINLAL